MSGRPSITESMFRTLMERVLSGAIPPGTRIEANEIAAVDGVSPTPVRNALNRLAGAGFILSHSNEGFFAPLLSEQELRDLYDSCSALLSLAITRAANARTPSTIDSQNVPSDTGVELKTELAFRDIMALCGNKRLSGALADASLHLRPIRRLEGEWISNRDSELRRILRAFAALDLSELDRLVNAYHRRRIRLVAKIVARMQDHRERHASDSRSAIEERE
jgi:DNA-binding transcriptional regulator YhcF (GntR family)